VNGRAWPAGGPGCLLLPAGRNVVERDGSPQRRWLADFNGRLLNLEQQGGAWFVEYESRSRAIAIFDDGKALLLPAGKQRRRIR
jgi:hypothetical protein